MPLWDCDMDAARAVFKATCPYFLDAQFTANPLFLGIFLGVGGNVLTWERMKPKFVSAVNDIAAMGLGLYAPIALYNSIAHSQLHYRAQMQPPSKQMIKLDDWALHRLSIGPFNAVTSNLLRNAKRFIGARLEAMDIHVTSVTAPASAAVRKSKVLLPCVLLLKELI